MLSSIVPNEAVPNKAERLGSDRHISRDPSRPCPVCALWQAGLSASGLGTSLSDASRLPSFPAGGVFLSPPDAEAVSAPPAPKPSALSHARPAQITSAQHRTGAGHRVPGSTFVACRFAERFGRWVATSQPYWPEVSSGRISKPCARELVSSVASAIAPPPESSVLTRSGLRWTLLVSSLRQATACSSSRARTAQRWRCCRPCARHPAVGSRRS